MGRELALVCGDGGIKGGFIAGAVTALLERLPEEMSQVKTIAASSASVGSMFYFLSHGLDHPGREIWLEDLASANFLRYDSIRSAFGSRPIYDIDFLVYEVFKTRHPLNIELIKTSPIEFYFPVLNHDTLEIEYFSNGDSTGFVRDGKLIEVHDFRNHDIYDMIKAASSAPFVWDRCMEINGQRYLDAATLEPFALDIPALRGKKKIVVVSKANFSLRRNMSYYLSGMLWPFIVTPFKNDKLRREIYFQYMRKPSLMKRLQDAAEVLQCADDLVFIKPMEKLGSNTDNSSDTLRRNFEHGEAVVALRLREIEGFLRR